MKKLQSFQLFCFLILISIHSTWGWRPFRVDVLNFTAYSLDENTLEVNATLSESNEVDIYINLKQNTLHPFVKIEFYVDSGKGLFDMKLLNETVNICRFFRDKRYLSFMQIVYKNLAQQGNFPTSCPIKKNLYVGQKMKLDAEKLPPTFPDKQLYMAATLMSRKDSKLIPIGFCKSITHIRKAWR